MPTYRVGENTADDYNGYTDQSYTLQSSPTSNYYNNGYWQISQGANANTIRRAFFKTYGLPTLFSGTNIGSATLNIYCYDIYSNATDLYCAAYRLLQDMVIDEVTWDSYSSGNSWNTSGCSAASDSASEDGSYDRTATPEDSVNYTEGGWFSLDVTDLVQGWVSGTYSEYGILLKETVENTSDLSYLRYSGSADGVRPYLEITTMSGVVSNMDFSDEVPTSGTVLIGGSINLGVRVDVSGSESSYTYDAAFYTGTGTQIGSTISGVSSGDIVYSDIYDVSSSGTYDWYVGATSSGVTYYSPTYSFETTTNNWYNKKLVKIFGSKISGTHTDIPLAFQISGVNAQLILDQVERRENFTRGTSATSHNIGSNDDGWSTFSLYNTPVDNGDYITFDGTDDGLYSGSTWGSESTITGIYAKFRIHDKDKGSAQVIWKSGGNGTGVAIGLDASGDLGIFARNTSVESIVITNSELYNDVWYELYAYDTKIVLKSENGTVLRRTNELSFGNGSSNESLGFAYDADPISGNGGGNYSYFDGDIDIVEIYTGDLKNPWDNAPYDIAWTTNVGAILAHEVDRVDYTNNVINCYVKVPTVSSGVDTDLYIYYGNSSYSDTDYTPEDVWDSSHSGVYHFNDSASKGSMLWDSTSNQAYFGDESNTGTKTDFENGSVGYAVYLDGSTNAGWERTSLMAPDDNGTAGQDSVVAIFKTTTSGQEGIIWKEGGYGLGHGVGVTADDKARVAYADVSGRIDSSSTVNDGQWHSVFGTFKSSPATVKGYNDGILTNTLSTYEAIGGSLPSVGYSYDSDPVFLLNGAGHPFYGWLSEIRIYNDEKSEDYVKTIHENLVNNSDFFWMDETLFIFSNEYPSDGVVAYGPTKNLKIKVTISGSESSYVYDATFYTSGDVQIGSTVSGTTNSGIATSDTYSTPSGINYSWYVGATSSGITQYSDVFTFINRFLCGGYVEIDGNRAGGVPVRLYRRSDGTLVSGTESTTPSGIFTIDSPYNEYHYAVALASGTDTNAIIYDWLMP